MAPVPGEGLDAHRHDRRGHPRLGTRPAVAPRRRARPTGQAPGRGAPRPPRPEPHAPLPPPPEQRPRPAHRHDPSPPRRLEPGADDASYAGADRRGAGAGPGTRRVGSRTAHRRRPTSRADPRAGTPGADPHGTNRLDRRHDTTVDDRVTAASRATLDEAASPEADAQPHHRRKRISSYADAVTDGKRRPFSRSAAAADQENTHTPDGRARTRSRRRG
jgi:hypothetical protein